MTGRGIALTTALLVVGPPAAAASPAHTAALPRVEDAAPVQATDAQARASQWWFDALGITRAHTLTRGEGVHVCVVDGGAAASWPGLAGVRWGDVKNLTPTLRGTRREGHGEQVVSLLAAQPDQPLRGVAPGVTVDARVFAVDAPGAAPGAALAQAIVECADLGAEVISVSLQAPLLDPRAIAYAQSRDVVVVAGSGNDPSLKSIFLPAGGFGVLSVAGTGPDLAGDGGSTRHGYVLAAARRGGDEPGPGDRQGVAVMGPSTTGRWTATACDGVLFASGRPGWYVRGCGTSYATPVVAGVVALVRARHPELNAANVVNRILRTATPPPGAARAAGPSPRYGYGTVNAYAALTAEVPLVDANPLGSLATGGRGVWDGRVRPLRPEPAAGVRLAPAPLTSVVLDDPARATSTPVSTPPRSPHAGASASTARPSVTTRAPARGAAAGTAAEEQVTSGGPTWWLLVLAGGLAAAAGAALAARRRRG